MSRTAAKENVGLTYNSVDLRAHLNSVSMEDVVEVIESMTFASTAIEKGRALRHSRSAWAARGARRCTRPWRRTR